MDSDRKSTEIEPEKCELALIAPCKLPDSDNIQPSSELAGNAETGLPLSPERVWTVTPTESSIRPITPRSELPQRRSDSDPLRCTRTRREKKLSPPRSLSFLQRLIQRFRRVENNVVELADQQLDGEPSACSPQEQQGAPPRPDLEQEPPEQIANIAPDQPVGSRRRWLARLWGSSRQDRRSQELPTISARISKREATSAPTRPNSLAIRNSISVAGPSSTSEPVAMGAVSAASEYQTPISFIGEESSTPTSSPTMTAVTISSPDSRVEDSSKTDS